MKIWIIAAALGILLSIYGFVVIFRQYQRQEISKKILAAYFVGYLSFLSYLLISLLIKDSLDGLPALAVLLPAFLAVVVLAREYSTKK